MERLAALGDAVEPILRTHLADPAIRNEVAVVLSKVGNLNTVSALIEVLPSKESLSPSEEFSYTCVVYTLWELTDVPLGIDGRMTQDYSPDIRKRWRQWYESHRDYLVDGRSRIGVPNGPTGARVFVDHEARLLGFSTRSFRQSHPWVSLDEVREWQEGGAYEDRLRRFCLSRLYATLSWGNDYDSDAILCLGDVDDPGTLTALTRLGEELSGDDTSLVWVGWALRDKGAAAIPVLERLAASKEGTEVRYLKMALACARVDAALGTKVASSRVETEQIVLLGRCVDGGSGVPELAKRLGDPGGHAFAGDIEIAGFVKDGRVRSALETICGMPQISDECRIRTSLALARHGDPAPVGFLRKQLSRDRHEIRLYAAEALWEAGSRDGFDALVGLLGLHPLEDGHGPVRSRTYTPPKNGSSLFLVRRACELLGEMGDARAVGALKALCAENLNGVLGETRSGVGTGWYGRPDVVALAKLGDDAGVDILRRSIRDGDPLGVAGDRSRQGDFVEIGRKRFARELLPLLACEDRERPLYAARGILRLLDRGK